MDVQIYLLNGFVWGTAIALVALGLSLVFGLVEIINLAHGELYMLGAVLSVYILALSNSFLITVVVTPVIVGAIGLFIERFVLRKIEKDPSATLIATFGLAMFLQYAVLWWFGGAPRRVSDPIGMSFSLGEINYPVYRLVIAAVSLMCFALFHLFLSRTRYGLWMRSVGQDSELAASLGIPVARIFWITFGAGSLFAAIAGVMMAPVVAVEFKMGLDVLILAFMASIIGGLGNLKGTFVAGISIGIVESLLAIPLSPTYAHIALLVVVASVLAVRPQGLFSSRVVIT